MANVGVVKQTAEEKPQVSRRFGFDAPLFGGGLLNPFALMRQFTDEMDRFFGQAPGALATGATWSPVIEVKEKEGKLLVTAELPGLKKEDVKVRIEGDTLIVEGERQQEKEEKREGYYRSERSYGKFYRSLMLPDGAKAEETTAQFNDGVLEVTIPIPEVKVTKQEVPVQEGVKKAG